MRFSRQTLVNLTIWRRTPSIETTKIVHNEAPLRTFPARRHNISSRIDPLAYRALRIRREWTLAR
jgi:hypothetical protein